MSDTEANVAQPPLSRASTALKNFSSQWFLLPQGTGIIAVILHQLDYQFNGLRTISTIIWIYTILLLAVTLILYLLRVVIHPRHVLQELNGSLVETSGLSSISIAFTSVIQMLTLRLVPEWGDSWGTAASVLWWINTAMAVIAVIGIPYVFVKLQAPGIQGISPPILLPLIAALTSAAGGGVVCRYGNLSEHLQIPIIIVSYLEVGAGLLLALGLENIFMARLLEGSPLKQEQIYQAMIVCGPFGQGSFALQILGQAVQRGSFAEYNHGTFLTAEAAGPIGFASQFIGLLVWGYGTFWWCFAVISIVHAFITRPGGWRKARFTLSAWTLVFPWGVYTNAAVSFGKLMDSTAFRVWSTILIIILVVICIVNHVLTIKGLISGKLLSLDHRDKDV